MPGSPLPFVGLNPPPLVARVRCEGYARTREAVRRSLELLSSSGPPLARRDDVVLVKPNLLCAAPPERCVTTHPAVVDAALEIVSDLGARAVVGDSPGAGSLQRVACAAGLLPVCQRHNVVLVDLGENGYRVHTPAGQREYTLAAEALAASQIWNLAKWKTHSLTGLTLAAKNLYGTLPGKRKALGHLQAGMSRERFARIVLDILALLHPRLHLLDGVQAMEGAGPSHGRPIDRHLILASRHAHALDWEAARLSGFRASQVPTLALALREGLLDPHAVTVAGDEARPMAFRKAQGTPGAWLLPRTVREGLRRRTYPTPRIDPDACRGCTVCWQSCPTGALSPQTPPALDPTACIRCYCCSELCPEGAVSIRRC